MECTSHTTVRTGTMILLLFVLFIGLNVGAFAASEVSTTNSWVHFTKLDGTEVCIDDGRVCTVYYNEDAPGDYSFEGTFC